MNDDFHEAHRAFNRGGHKEIEEMYKKLGRRQETPNESGSSAGRPRLEARPSFLKALKQIMPHVLDGTISYNKAAERLGISRRSLKRYAEAHGLI